jgi:sensor histidine kinase YesM
MLLLYILLIFLTCFLIWSRYEVYFLKQKNKENIKFNKDVAELELTALRAQMNPHFIFNALGSIQYFIQTQDTDKADSYLSDFAMLIRIILESSKSKFISLSEEVKFLSLYARLEKMRFEDQFTYEFKIDKEIDFHKPIPPLIIQPFVENAINHGIYNLKGKKGRLLIYFQYVNPNEIIIRVRDNGVGRNEASKLKKSPHSSRGTELVNTRVQTINNQNDIRIDVQTIDLEAFDQPRGTEIKIRISYDLS